MLYQLSYFRITVYKDKLLFVIPSAEAINLLSVHDFFERCKVFGIVRFASIRCVRYSRRSEKCFSTLLRTIFIVLLTSPFCSVNASSTIANPEGNQRSGNSPAKLPPASITVDFSRDDFGSNMRSLFRVNVSGAQFAFQGIAVGHDDGTGKRRLVVVN